MFYVHIQTPFIELFCEDKLSLQALEKRVTGLVHVYSYIRAICFKTFLLYLFYLECNTDREKL